MKAWSSWIEAAPARERAAPAGGGLGGAEGTGGRRGEDPRAEASRGRCGGGLRGWRGDGGAVAGGCGGGWPWKMDRPAIWNDFFFDVEDWQQLWMDRQTRDTRCMNVLGILDR